MISVVLYGRNDAHGYNLHRRAALSLNCLAEVLTDPDDELLFVDYNTPDELPTFVEAIADTLTERCIDRLRVIRVPAAVHRERFATRTHLPALEPVARNVAVRRANPANRWLLSTNTDMLFLPRASTGLTEACADLPDGFYGLPRFELPEWLWERLPRSDPGRVLSELARLGPLMSLDEPTVSDEWIRFDAPGDFQLCLREDIVSIDAFDEEMLLGWHVDSNFSRRMVIHRGSIETFEERADGYHCNHSRIPTIYHDSPEIANDLDRFYASLETAELPEQRDSWGLAGVGLDEVQLRRRIGIQLADVLARAAPTSNGERVPSRVHDWVYGLTYDSAHVLPFIADSIAVSAGSTTVGYLGANDVMREMLGRLSDELDELRLEVAMESVDGLVDADVLVVDLGLDASASEPFGAAKPGESPTYPDKLRPVLVGLEQLVERERARLSCGAHPRRFVLVNSATSFTDSFVLANFDCTHTSIHSRVRRATTKPIATPTADGDVASVVAEADRLIRWTERLRETPSSLQVLPGVAVDLAHLDEFDAFGEDWYFPEPTGMWTRGRRVELRLATTARRAGRHLLRLRIARVGARPDESLRLRISIDAVTVAEGWLAGGPIPATIRVPIPLWAIDRGTLELRLELGAPTSWLEDPRELGVCVRSIALQRDGLGRRAADVAAALRAYRTRLGRRLARRGVARRH